MPAPRPTQETSLWRRPASVHHPGVGVVLELHQVVGRVTQHERPVHLDEPVEPRADVGKELDLALDAQLVERVEVATLTEVDTEVPRIEAQLGRTRARRLR